MPCLKQFIFSKISYLYSTSCLKVSFTLVLQVTTFWERDFPHSPFQNQLFSSSHILFHWTSMPALDTKNLDHSLFSKMFQVWISCLQTIQPISIKTNYQFSPWPFLLISSSLSFSLTLSVLFLHSSIATHSMAIS